jgi:hypothetical protein
MLSSRQKKNNDKIIPLSRIVILNEIMFRVKWAILKKIYALM